MLIQSPRSPARNDARTDSRIRIRVADEFDTPSLSDLLAGLSPESRRRRFLGGSGGAALSSPPASLGVVAVIEEQGLNDGRVIGHATLYVDGEGGAEVAFVVADEFHRRGIGTALMRALVDHARRLGLRHLSAATYADNGAMRKLAYGTQGLGCRIVGDSIDMGVEEITLEIPPAPRAESGDVVRLEASPGRPRGGASRRRPQLGRGAAG